MITTFSLKKPSAYTIVVFKKISEFAVVTKEQLQYDNYLHYQLDAIQDKLFVQQNIFIFGLCTNIQIFVWFFNLIFLCRFC